MQGDGLMQQDKLLEFIEEQEELLTLSKISHRLNTPKETIQRGLSELKKTGKIHEITLEQMMRMEK